MRDFLERNRRLNLCNDPEKALLCKKPSLPGITIENTENSFNINLIRYIKSYDNDKKISRSKKETGDEIKSMIA